VRRGEIHAICGENGAGKSTLMKVLSGVYPYGDYTGDIIFDGEEVRFSSINASESKGIVIIHQELALITHLSIAENLFLGNERRGALGLIDWHRTNADARDLMARVGLRERPVTKIGHIGVGKQQLVEIAKALSKDVKLLILDEPTAALNDQDSEHLLGLLRQLNEQGVTCIMISHKLNEIASIADRTRRPPRTASSGGWSAGTWSTVTPNASRTSARRCCGWRTGPCTTPPRPTGWSSTAPTSRCGPGRWSASPA
jgi:putative multiple sugar transport system ATP-binding protein